MIEKDELQGGQAQVEEISDLLNGIAPVAPVAPEPTGETTTTTTTVEGGPTDGGKEEVPKGEERVEEKAGGQEQVGEPGGKEKEVIPDLETKPPDTTVPPVETKSPEETELERLKRENAELMAHLNEVAERTMRPREERPKTPEEMEAAKQQAMRQAQQVLKFLPNEEVFDNVLKSAESFNALLTSVVNVAVERSLRVVPQVANNLVDQQFTLRTMVRDFYDENKDLVPHKKYVGFVSNEIASQHADWDLPKILEETEKEVRSRLKLARVPGHIAGPNAGGPTGPGPTGPTRTVVDNPGFVPSGGGGRKGPVTPDGNLSAQEKDIMSLIG